MHEELHYSLPGVKLCIWPGHAAVSEGVDEQAKESGGVKLYLRGSLHMLDHVKGL